jgi:predicted  nucleic acid-binding Zn-ribbon protein
MSAFTGSPRRYIALGRIDEEKCFSSPKSAKSYSEVLSPVVDNKGSPDKKNNDPRTTAESREDGASTQLSPHKILTPEEMIQINEDLENECKELEATILQLRNDGNVLKMKTSITMSTYQNKIDSMSREMEMLVKQCMGLEEKISGLREENTNRQREILSIEGTLYRSESDLMDLPDDISEKQ